VALAGERQKLLAARPWQSVEVRAEAGQPRGPGWQQDLSAAMEAWGVPWLVLRGCLGQEGWHGAGKPWLEPELAAGCPRGCGCGAVLVGVARHGPAGRLCQPGVGWVRVWGLQRAGCRSRPLQLPPPAEHQALVPLGAREGCSRGSVASTSILPARLEEVGVISLKKGVVVGEQLQNAKERS